MLPPRFLSALVEIVAITTILNALQGYFVLAMVPNKRKRERELLLGKHFFVLFIDVLCVEKVKIKMFLTCSLPCVDAALRLTIGNAYPGSSHFSPFLFYLFFL